MSPDFSRHHVIPTSVGGSNSKANIVRLNHKYHVAFHMVFNNLAPHEQLERILNIANTALRQDFKERIFKVLDNDPRYFYKDGILVPRQY